MMAKDGRSGRSAVSLGLELLALSFVALFFELMVIRWAPAVVRLVAYYANLMLISSFLGLGVGAAIGHARRSIYAWMPLLIVLDVGVLLLAQHVSMPTSGEEFRFHRASAGLLNYVMLIAIFACNAADDGLLALSFRVRQPWLIEKLIHMVDAGTGQRPLVYFDHD